MRVSRLLALAFVILLCAVSLTSAQSSMGFENCTGHLVAPVLPWYRPSGSSAVCVADGRAHGGFFAAMAAPQTAYGPVCQDILLDAGTINVDLWCRTSGNQQRSVAVALRAAGGAGGDLDTAPTLASSKPWLIGVMLNSWRTCAVM